MSVILTIMCAFASGAFGAMLGAMPSVILVGMNVCIGAVAALCGSPFNWLGNITLGMFLGPHVGFGPACVVAGSFSAEME